MRLTKQMKENLFNIIKNKTTKPLTQTFLDEMKGKIQEIVWQEEPLFKQYYDKYGFTYGSRLSLNFSENNTRFRSQYKKCIDVLLPNIDDQMSILLQDEFKVNQLKHDTKVHYICRETLEFFKPEYQTLFTEILDKLDEQLEYRKVMNELETIINTFTTDTALVQAYPDFEQYFLQAGITNKPKKALPSVTGLPDVLSKYGVKLKKDSLEEEIRQEVIEGENKE